MHDITAIVLVSLIFLVVGGATVVMTVFYCWFVREAWRAAPRRHREQEDDDQGE